jgi:uncharacterized membrane protein YkvA (DUF1232 family)
MFKNLKACARTLENETIAVYLAAKDPRTPWYAKAVAFFTVAYAFSPIDLIPDFIPLLGYLDDLIIIPAGIALAIRLIPVEVLEDARETVATQNEGRSVGYVGFIFVVLVWTIVLLGVDRLIRFLL